MDITLDPRAVEFLLESNAIEGITNIDYHDPVRRQPDRGHWSAFVDMVEKASQFPPLRRHNLESWYPQVRDTPYRALTIEDICQWQGMIAAEQIEAGHELRRDAVGMIRSPQLPVDVFVGRHVAPSYEEVPERLAEWLDSLNRTLSTQRVIASDVTLADCLGTHFQWFEAIHPFVDGNGRTGRLVANYIMTYYQSPLIVFRASERPAYYPAHRSKPAMRVFIADKIRERFRTLDGDFQDRERSNGATDVFPGGLVERHELLRARAEWAREADAKDQQR